MIWLGMAFGRNRDKRQIREHLADPDMRPKFRRNQITQAAELTQAGVDCQGHAQGSVIHARDCHVTQ